MDKSLYQAPQGLEETTEEGLSIDIVDPEMVTLDDGRDRKSVV